MKESKPIYMTDKLLKEQLDKARAEVAREIFKELDNVWFLDVLYEPDYEQLKEKYIKE